MCGIPVCGIPVCGAAVPGHAVPGIFARRPFLAAHPCVPVLRRRPGAAVPGAARGGHGGQFGTHRTRLQVGHAVDGDGAIGVIEQDRLGKPGHPGAQMNPGGVEQPAAEPEPASRVVVSADRHHPRTRITHPDQPVLAQREGVG